MDTKKFLGEKLPKDIGYEVYPGHVTFYRLNSDEGVWELLGFVPKPYKKQPLSWWKTELKKIGI
jgi:hypothetical protein